VSRERSAGQNHVLKISNNSSKRVEQFRYLGTTVKNKNFIHERIRSRLLFGAEYFVFGLTVQKFKDKIYRTIIFPFGLLSCETWYLTLKEKHRLGVFENRAVEMFGPKRDEVAGE
jgi:hypothetical protein